MPRVALALCFVFFVSLFVVRSVVQYRRTGSTGVKGFSGRIGSLPWVAGSSASLGLALAPVSGRLLRSTVGRRWQPPSLGLGATPARCLLRCRGYRRSARRAAFDGRFLASWRR